MTQHFQFHPLSRETFEPLLRQKENDQLPKHTTWMTVDAHPGYPCRVSLRDAPLGSRVLALSHRHHDVASPYRASGPIFVHEDAVTAKPEVDQIPEVCRHRDLSLRAYNTAGMMIDADAVHGSILAETLRGLFTRPEVAYVHVHNAKPGCFACAVTRA